MNTTRIGFKRHLPFWIKNYSSPRFIIFHIKSNQNPLSPSTFSHNPFLILCVSSNVLSSFVSHTFLSYILIKRDGWAVISVTEQIARQSSHNSLSFYLFLSRPFLTISDKFWCKMLTLLISDKMAISVFVGIPSLWEYHLRISQGTLVPNQLSSITFSQTTIKMGPERLTVHIDGAVKIKWPERLVQKDENGRFWCLTHPESWISQKASFVDRYRWVFLYGVSAQVCGTALRGYVSQVAKGAAEPCLAYNNGFNSMQWVSWRGGS